MRLNLRYHLLLITCKLFAMLPYRIIYGLGWLGGSVSYVLNIKANQTTRTNITRCFPELSLKQQEHLIKHAMQHAATRVLEMIFFWFAPIKRILKTVRSVQGEEMSIAKAAQQKIGQIGMHLHHGAWELLNCYLGNRYPISVLYKPPSDLFQEKLLKQARERLTKTTMYPISMKGIKYLMDDLRAGHCLGISPDHVPAEGKGVWAPFFGIPTLTMTLASKIAKKTQATAFLCFSLRLPKGKGFSIHIEPIDPAFYDNDPITAATTLNQAIETIVRKNPAQYEWSYKRFRKRPPDEQGEDFYHA